jgi:predicted MFS family arabinose efflux permease
MLATLLLEPLEAVGLGILLGRLIQLLFLGVLPLGLLLYCWRVWRQTTRQVQRTPEEEEEAHVKHRNGYLRLLLVLIMAVVGIIALY